jgi:hypothetical protein
LWYKKIKQGKYPAVYFLIRGGIQWLDRVGSVERAPGWGIK